MKPDNRLCRMLHVLIHLDRHASPATSESIASMLRTNPVVIRRTMAGLRDAGHVTSEKGHGGGWRLAQALSQITLLDIHRALGERTLFTVGLANSSPTCVAEQAANQAIAGALQEAQRVLEERLAAITLEAVAKDFDRLVAEMGEPPTDWPAAK
ncbi:Rrf2 family transcriptional regulator [Halopseudomonas pachastrellae]|uniref:Rrf2 family transcriptional regulator n=1 Tax=Halopseudomonas pachastrellae TaxID=254161 RepID=UPI003D7E03C4